MSLMDVKSPMEVFKQKLEHRPCTQQPLSKLQRLLSIPGFPKWSLYVLLYSFNYCSKALTLNELQYLGNVFENRFITHITAKNTKYDAAKVSMPNATVNIPARTWFNGSENCIQFVMNRAKCPRLMSAPTTKMKMISSTFLISFHYVFLSLR